MSHGGFTVREVDFAQHLARVGVDHGIASIGIEQVELRLGFLADADAPDHSRSLTCTAYRASNACVLRFSTQISVAASLCDQ